MEDDDGGVLKLTWAYLDGLGGSYLRKGIGREIVKRMSELTGYAVEAEENDGHRQDDGSHLTGDAPAFMAKLRKERLIQ